jgi:predicted dehydrogenase
MKPIRYGLIGCGGFGKFCLEAYGALKGLECIAVADVNPVMAEETARHAGLICCTSPEELLAREDIDIVHLATPPFTHPRLAMAALEAGKHVLCEKPLALSLEEAEAMVKLAADRHLVLAVNLIMRYNPLCLVVKKLVESRILGSPLHASLINTASDEQLEPEHWFWDRFRSGGIFIEHGVHFFDLFEWWFGPGQLLSADQLRRPGTGFVDQVQCTVQYNETTLGSFYHGFHQMKRRDAQHWSVTFELGSLTLTEWVPTRLELDVSLSEYGWQALEALLPGATLVVQECYTGSSRTARSRHQDRVVDLRGTAVLTSELEKMPLYGNMLRALMQDQLDAIRDPAHVRRVSEINGVTSLATAVGAQWTADQAAPA